MRFRLTWSLAALALAVAPAFAADDKDQTITDPKDAGPDYAVQGEYTGKLGNDEAGAQVVALGGGKFDLVLYTGGLPGAGWERGDERIKATGETKDGDTTFKAKDWTASLKDGTITIKSSAGEAVGQLKKTERKSKTLGAKPPEGATVLFDGTSAEAWLRGKLTDDKLLMSDCETKQKFGDFTLHIEFRTPFKPYARGQARGNSGVYIQNRYECQVLDSFGLEGENNECGGIYSIAKPNVNMCYPPLTWQTYDIEFTAARYEGGKKVKNAVVTILHNGVAIHNALELTHGTPGKNPEGPGGDGIYLQGHGNPVVYRNIWIVEKKDE